MSGNPWHKRYHSNALSGYMALTLEERGAYTTLLDMLYDRGEPIVENERLIAGYLGVSLRKARAVLESLIEKGKIRRVDGGLLTNDRFEKERENDAKTTRKLAENGSKGGRARAERAKSSSEINDTGQATLDDGSSLLRSQKPEPEKKEEPKGSLPSVAGDSVPKMPEDIAAAFSAYNAAAVESGWPECRVYSKERQGALAQRLREAGGLSGWAVALSKAQASAHCCGDNDRGWRCNFDFLTAKSKFTKLMEGNYDNRSPNGPPGQGNSGGRRDAHHSLVAGFAAAAYHGDG